MNPVLQRWNEASADNAVEELLACCGSRQWAAELAASRPYAEPGELLLAAETAWRKLPESEWLAAFQAHPRIGETRAEQPAGAHSGEWSRGEQAAVLTAVAEDAAIRAEIAEANREYEARFGRIYLVCASGRSPGELLAICRTRIHNTTEQELAESAEQQRQILLLRMRRWLAL